MLSPIDSGAWTGDYHIGLRCGSCVCGTIAIAAGGVDPLGARLNVMFLFPDWDIVFERVDQPFGSGKGLATMRAANGDGHAGLSRENLARAVNDRHQANRPFRLGLLL